jgi:hypothetical protein
VTVIAALGGLFLGAGLMGWLSVYVINSPAFRDPIVNPDATPELLDAAERFGHDMIRAVPFLRRVGTCCTPFGVALLLAAIVLRVR